MNQVEDTHFYIAVGVLGGVLCIAIILIIILFVFVFSINRTQKEIILRQQEKSDDFRIKRAHLKNSNLTQYPDMYGSNLQLQSKNPLANSNNVGGRNSAFVEELKRNSKQSSQQPRQQLPTQPLQPQVPLHQQGQPALMPNQQRDSAQNTYEMDNKNFFY